MMILSEYAPPQKNENYPLEDIHRQPLNKMNDQKLRSCQTSNKFVASIKIDQKSVP
jgi:hypothetical protein